MTEEERAALFRRQAQAREDARFRRWLALSGSQERYRQRLAATQALMRDEGWDPVASLSAEEEDLLN